jgi:hypothetical protein
MFSANSSQVSDSKLFVEDVFSTYLYAGNGTIQTITNGIDLAGKDGMLWLKNRNDSSDPLHYLNFKDGSVISSNNSNNTSAKQVMTPYLSFNSNGFTVNALPGFLNNSGVNYASWTFREAPKFFDVVTWTGDGATFKTINHNLGIEPGMIVVKRTNGPGTWYVYHRSTGQTSFLTLNGTGAAVTDASGIWNATSTTFDARSFYGVNGSGDTYIAYLYAHDTASDGIIQCGSYTGDGTDNYSKSIELGWEPQFILVKRASTTGNWFMVDNMRGMPVNRDSPAFLYADLSASEGAGTPLATPYATGFTVAGGNINNSGVNVIYIAIRRGPMKTPTLGTSVFVPSTRTGTGTTTVVSSTTFPPDLLITRPYASNDAPTWFDRLRGRALSLLSSSTGADTTTTTTTNDLISFNMNGITVGANQQQAVNTNGASIIDYNLRRAPGFFDEVCYTGTGSTRTVAHNLGVVPELMIVKRRSASGGWSVFLSMTPSNYKRGQLNGTDTPGTQTYIDGFGLSAQPTSTVMNFDSGGAANESGTTYVSYLFASCAGVSKVGSYTGNGSSQTINCAFAAGARFVMIKRTDSTGDWYVWDTARGIVAGNDPHLSLNTTVAEVTTDDTIDTDSSGFVVNQVAATNVNVSSATYIFLAIA